MLKNYHYKLSEIRETVSFGLPLLLEKCSVAIWVCAIILGSYAHFYLVHWSSGPEPEVCHFADASILFIECPGTLQDGRLAVVLNWAWLWTWGIVWLVGLLPFSLLLVVPAVLTAFFALRSMLRWLVRQRPRPARATADNQPAAER